ncbi:hypothetical protein AArcSl_1899 [Halalkaliarchaeum desulfuricum]|uniref:Uncharacterized protein n=1 Tax=Halalkaliarchaeum desulfuricum TaxID=2055893 RepID=A0A343TKA3_9EURY|nr:hypothetical protein [Halalkaliarchaeum desulfuricum]AUX09525.1 hypothetical protein AArcSl_1899 [Halalkaliarchaeum desulfuricum]
MVQRREFLRKGVSVTAVAAAVGLSGCLGQEGSEDVEAAFDLLEENQEVLDEFEELEDDELPDQAEIDGIKQRIDEAEDHLDAADAVAEDEEIQEAVQLGYSIAEFQLSLVQALEAINSVIHGLDTIVAQIDADRVDDALETSEELLDDASEANEKISESIDALDEIDDDRLDTQERIELGVDKAKLERVDNEFDVFEEMIHGFVEMIQGLQALEAMIDALEDENLDDALDKAEIAEFEFESAASRFEEIEDDPDLPAHMEADVIEISADANDLRDATGHYADGIRAAQRGDWDAFEEHMEKAEAALE